MAQADLGAASGNTLDALDSVLIHPRLFASVDILRVLPTYDVRKGAIMSPLNWLTSRITTTSTCAKGAATPGIVLAGLASDHETHQSAGK